MTEFKGTKGKWEVNEYHDGDLIGISVESDLYGTVLFDTGSCGYIDDEEISNAKLIAAAPEMLEMLLKCKDLVLRKDTSIEIEKLINKILD